MTLEIRSQRGNEHLTPKCCSLLYVNNLHLDVDEFKYRSFSPTKSLLVDTIRVVIDDMKV